MLIRSAKDSDYEELMGLYNLFVESDRYSEHDSDSFHKVLNNPNNFIFIAEDEGAIIGFLTFSVRDVIRYPKQITEVDELFVLEEYRKHGVGKKLMEHMEDKAKELNCHKIFIESSSEREGAHKFYESIGFINNGYHFIKNLS